MRRPSRKTWLTVAVVAPVLAVALYWLTQYARGVYHQHAARQALDQRDFDIAQLHLQHAIDIRPRDAALRLLAAQTARRQRDYGAANVHLRELRRLRVPDDVLILEETLRRVQDGELADAESLLASCVEHPDAPETPLILEALIEGSLKVVGAAAGYGIEMHLAKDAMLRRAVDLWLRQRTGRPEQAQGLVWRGRLEGYDGAHAEAVADFRAALELEPNHFDARWNLADRLLSEAPTEAADHLEILRRRHPDSVSVRRALASVRRSLGQLGEAAQLLDDMLAETPDDVATLIERSKVALDQEQAAEAEQTLRRAEKLAPDLPEVYLGLARCLNLAGRSPEAQRCQERFLQLESERKAKQTEMLQQAKLFNPG